MGPVVMSSMAPVAVYRRCVSLRMLHGPEIFADQGTIARYAVVTQHFTPSTRDSGLRTQDSGL
jgi:hypothetical protein